MIIDIFLLSSQVNALQLACILQNIRMYENHHSMHFKNAIRPTQNYDYEIELDDGSDDKSTPHRHRHRARKLKGNKEEMIAYVYDDYNEDYSEAGSDECRCSCRNCEDTKPCCKYVCTNCYVENNPSNLILYPYPYPVVAPWGGGTGQSTTMEYMETTVASTASSIDETESTTTMAPTTSKEVETTQDPPKPEFDTKGNLNLTHRRLLQDSTELSDIFIKDRPNKEKILIASFRPTKPYWFPKYGIVPIPGRLAEKLMAKIRNTKRLENEDR